jgi:hypothetical protein
MGNEYMRLKFSFTPIVLVVIIKNEEKITMQGNSPRG